MPVHYSRAARRRNPKLLRKNNPRADHGCEQRQIDHQVLSGQNLTHTGKLCQPRYVNTWDWNDSRIGKGPLNTKDLAEHVGCGTKGKEIEGNAGEELIGAKDHSKKNENKCQQKCAKNGTQNGQ